MSAARAAALLAVLLAGCRTAAPEPETPPERPWIELFDGTSLQGFESSGFGGDGEVTVEDGMIRLGEGSPLTGVTWTGTAPAGDYELEVEAMRLSGIDFFCGLTFPVGERWLTLVLGGWGGGVCGLSSLDGYDASDNDTRTLRWFENGRLYRTRVRVAGTRIAVTIDGEPFLATDVAGRELSLRPEVELSRPLGVAAFATEAAVRVLRWRPIGDRIRR